MKLWLVLIQFLFVSFVWAADDILDVKIGVGDKFQNSQRSVYLTCRDIMDMPSIMGKSFKEIAFSMLDKTNDHVFGILCAQYSKTPQDPLVLSMRVSSHEHQKLKECLDTVMGIFRSEKRNHLVFKNFIIMYMNTFPDLTLLDFYSQNYKTIGNSPNGFGMFFELSGR